MNDAEMQAVAEYIDAAVELGVITALKALPAPPAPDVDAIATAVLARITLPKDGEPGTPGKDAEPVDKDALVAEIVALIPKPENGKDAPPVDMVALAKDVLALIPVPRDGRDGIASRDELMALVNAKVAELLPAAVEQRVTEVLAAMPEARYRGVWRAENEYREGNSVTFGGSQFHCNVTGTKAKPEDGSPDWTLMVKRGRDGKDAK